MRIKGFAVCDEHDGSLVTYDEKECPICEKIRDLEEEINELVIDRDSYEAKLKEAKENIADIKIELHNDIDRMMNNRDNYFIKLKDAKAEIAQLVIDKGELRNKIEELKNGEL